HKYANLFYQQYIQVGEYANQLKRYLNVFNRENILLIDYEDFKKDVAAVVNKTYLFLGVNDDFQPNLNKKHNTYSMPKNRIIRYIYSFVLLRNLLTSIFSKEMIKSTRNFLFKSDKKPIMQVETRLFLKKHFEKDVYELSELLNKDYTKWIK
ncbi:MAG: sulfotransferase domain-containing protein, partial [Flavobacteriales bacterium]|nr:sulfotransferase domain-containing protein [Flavobacteriales bacterium]